MLFVEIMDEDEKLFWTEERKNKYYQHLSICVDDGPKYKHRRNIKTIKQLHAAWNCRLTFHMTLGRTILSDRGDLRAGHFLSTPEEAREIYKDLKKDPKVWLS